MATSRMETPKGLRLHFGLFGKRNAGKSSLINALANQNISIVSSVAGTTTDPVEKAFELSPIGPVVFMDTAGIDDVGDLGQARVQKSLSVLEWMDIAIVVCESGFWGEHEENILKKTKLNGTPTIIVFNKIDLRKPEAQQISSLRQRGYRVIEVSAVNREGIGLLRDALIETVLEKTEPDRPLMGDLAKAGDTVILVTPIDTGAPKGRLILPQVQAIRELLDAGAKCLVIKEDRITETLNELRQPPQLVVTDSQVVLRVVKEVPEPIPITTFSIQMAYSKSDLLEMAIGAAALTKLKPGDKVLIAETCSHHPLKPMVKMPVIPGHEVGAVIDAVGPGVPESFKKGMNVTLNPYTNCGKCASCRNGRVNACEHNETLGVQRNGVMCEYAVLPWSKVIPAEGISSRDCALIEPMSVGFHAVSRAQVIDNEVVMVIGCGMVGMGAIVRAALRGATVIAVDLDDEKLALARKVGAAYVINSRTENVHERVQEYSGGLGADVVIEAVGSPATYVMAVDEVSFTGRVVCIGYAKSGVEFQTKYFVQKELDIRGSRNALPADFRAVIHYMKTGNCPVEKLISSIVSPENASEAMEGWAVNPGKVFRILVKF